MFTPHRKLAVRPFASTTFFILLALVFIGMSFVASEASATENELTVDFEYVKVKREHGRVEVAYKVSRTDWREMRDLEIQPRLNLYVPTSKSSKNYEFRYSARLKSRSGTVEFPSEIRLHGAPHVKLRLVGFEGFHRIDRMRVGSDCNSKLRFAVHYPTKTHKKYHKPSKHKRDKQRHGKNRRHDTAALIKACDDATASYQLSECIELAKALPEQSASATVKACDDATSWSGDFKSCLVKAGNYRRNAAPAVRACGKATSWSGDFEKCLDNARGLGRQAGEIVQACDESTNWSGDFQKCIRSSAYHNDV